MEPSESERNRRRFNLDGSWDSQLNGENIIHLENLLYVWYVGKIKIRNYESKKGNIHRILANSFTLIIEAKNKFTILEAEAPSRGKLNNRDMREYFLIPDIANWLISWLVMRLQNLPNQPVNQ